MIDTLCQRVRMLFSVYVSVPTSPQGHNRFPRLSSPIEHMLIQWPMNENRRNGLGKEEEERSTNSSPSPSQLHAIIDNWSDGKCEMQTRVGASFCAGASLAQSTLLNGHQLNNKQVTAKKERSASPHWHLFLPQLPLNWSAWARTETISKKAFIQHEPESRKEVQQQTLTLKMFLLIICWNQRGKTDDLASVPLLLAFSVYWIFFCR